jgi:hypothetical protein
MGVVSPNGIGSESFGRACIAGRSGVVRLQGIDTTGLKSSVAAQVLDFDPLSVMEVAEIRRVPRMIPMALAASREAMRQARVELAEDDIEGQRQIGCSLGTGGGGLAFVEEQYRTFFTEGKGLAVFDHGGDAWEFVERTVDRAAASRAFARLIDGMRQQHGCDRLWRDAHPRGRGADDAGRGGGFAGFARNFDGV